MDKSQNQNKMGVAPLFPLIMKMSLPAMLSMLISALYNIVDSYFVSKISSTDDHALAALSLAFPIQNLMGALAVGTAIGTSALIARRLGEQRKEDAERIAVHGMLLSSLTYIAVAILGCAFAGKFLSLFTDDGEILSMGVTYVSICCLFSFGFFIQVSCEKILQATGNMILPMISHLVAAIANMILDPIFIFGYFGLPAMGVRGAAIATVAGQIIGMFIALFALLRSQKVMHVTFRGFRPKAHVIKEIYSVGLPTIVMQSVGTIMTTSMNAILSSFSMAAYTVFGLYFKLQSFAFMPVFGLTQGLLPILGFNYGAKNKKRITKALKIAVTIAVSFMLACALVFFLIPDKLLGIFSDTPEIIDIGSTALRIICFVFVPAGVSISLSTLFQAVGKGTYSLITSLLRQLVVLIPSAYLLSKVSLTAVWFSFPLAECFSFIITLFMLRRTYRTLIAPMLDADLSGAPAFESSDPVSP